MKIILRILLGLVASAVVACLICYIGGARLPREHHTQVSTTLLASRATVWAGLTDYAAMPQWWPAVKSVRFEKRADGTELTWNKDAHGQEIPFRTGESRPNDKLVRIIAKDDLPFGGSWTFELADAGNGRTKLTLTEDGYIDSPMYRAMATWFFGLDTTLNDFVTHFKKRVVVLENQSRAAR